MDQRTPPHLLRALVAGSSVWFLWLVGAIGPFDRVATDSMTFLRPASRSVSPIVVVAIDDATVDLLGPLPWPRAQLADLIRAAWDAGAAGVALDLVLPALQDPLADDDLAEALRRGPSILATAPLPGGGFVQSSTVLTSAATFAHASGELGRDGVIRRFRSTLDDGHTSYPALSLAAAQLLDKTIVTEAGGWIRPSFHFPPDQVPRIAASSLLQPAGGRVLQGRIAVIGITATGATDQFVVSAPRTRGPRPGVAIHAAAAHAILFRNFVREIPGWSLLLLCWLASVLAGQFEKRSGMLSFRGLLVALLVTFTLSTAALWGFDLVVPATTTFLAFGLSLFLFEVAESKRVERSTRLLLSELLEQTDTAARPSAGDGLQLARKLQAEVARDRDLRRHLLENLDEGVVLWDGDGEVLLSNRAAERLWGGLPEEGALRAAEAQDETEPLVSRAGRSLRVRGWEVEGGHLTVIRDLSARKALEDRKREMQRLVSHELKSPLASISGFGSMLRRYSLSREETERVASLVQAEADRLLNMVMTFLDLDRLGAHQPGDRVPVELEACLRGRLELLEVVARANGQELVLETDSLPSTILAIETLVERVIDNLVSNALKYSGSDSRVEIRIVREADWIEVRVSDQGPGIPEKALPHLFSRFYRVPGTSSPGSGLGLALVREITKWHGGCVGVESQLNEGSSFWVRFPAIDSGPVAP